MSSTVYCMVIVILFFCPETGGISITWKEPLPIQAISDDNQIHSSYTQLLEGTINATLSWLFSLSSDLTFSGVNLRFNGEIIGAVEQSGDVVVASGFEDKFDLRWIPYGRVILFVFNVTTEVNGTFGCDVLAKKVGTLTFKSTTQVDVVDPPSNIATSGDQTVSVSDELTLNCSADGKPKPTITWTRLSDNTIVTMPFNISSRQYGGYYRCTADNGVGNPLRKNVFINVLFPPIITIESKIFVGRGQTASLNCEVEGNPTPSIRWIPCDLQNIGCDKQYLNISKVLTSRAHYTCTASNSEGSDLETTLLIIGGKDIFLRISTSGECDKKDYVWETLQSELAKVFANTQNYIGAELIADIRCGSLTFDVNLKFNTRVAEDVIISTIRNAILHKKLGELRITVSSIIGIPPVPLPTTTKALKTTPKPESDDTWDIVGAVLGAVAFVVIAAVIIWCVRKKKYCSKEAKEFSSTNVSGQGRGHGAQSQNGDDESHGSTSVLRPFNTPGNRDKEDAGQAMALHVYAEVDKSNKKPRTETGGTRQSGELQYLQIDHSNNEGSLPRKSSSEPMIAPSYQETVYADLV